MKPFIEREPHDGKPADQRLGKGERAGPAGYAGHGDGLFGRCLARLLQLLGKFEHLRNGLIQLLLSGVIHGERFRGDFQTGAVQLDSKSVRCLVMIRDLGAVCRHGFAGVRHNLLEEAEMYVKFESEGRGRWRRNYRHAPVFAEAEVGDFPIETLAFRHGSLQFIPAVPPSGFRERPGQFP